MVEILRDAGLSALFGGTAEVETLAEGFVFTEGPLWCPDGALLFQDIKAERTYRLPLRPAGRPEVLRENTRAANGQTFAPDGRVVFCEQNGRRVSSMNTDGSDVRTVAETFQGQRLNSPNDVVCRASDGLIYFTDPPYGVSAADKELEFQGVFALDLSSPGTGNGLRVVADDFEKPNGLAFSPDGSTLYVCDTAHYHVRAFDVDPSGALKGGGVLAKVDPDRPGGPDGLKVDRDGRLYVAVAQGVWVFEPGGKLLGILALPKRPANLAWCGPDARTLAITAVDTVYHVRLEVAGVLPPFTPQAPPA
jgi:gluconolactonase